MKRNYKRILTLILAVLMLLTSLPAAGISAAQTVVEESSSVSDVVETAAATPDDFEYTIADGEVTITKYIGEAADVVVPATIEGLPVTVIGGGDPWNSDGAFRGNDNITSLVFPYGIREIGGYVGSYCDNLTTVVLPDSVESIGSYAFEYSEKITSINIPTNIKKIGVYFLNETGCYNDEKNWSNGVFYVDNALISAKDYVAGRYKIKDGTTVIANNAFANCDYLDAVIIPEGVTSIGYRAFFDCDNLTTAAIPDTVTSMGEDAFYRVNTVYFSGSEKQWNELLAQIRYNYFSNADVRYGCKLLESGLVLAELTSGEWTVVQYSGADSVTVIPSEVDSKPVTTIAEGAFSGDSDLHIFIPASVTAIEDSAFTVPYAHISYGSSVADWKAISIGEGNSVLYDAVRHYDVENGDSAYTLDVTAPACTEGGYTTYNCNFCSEQFLGDFTDATGHSYESEVIPPICESEGYTLHTCLNCGDYYTDNFVDKTDHYIEDGVCQACGRTQYIIESDHPYSDNTDNTWVTERVADDKIELKFSADTSLEKNYDYIYIYDEIDNLVGKYTGNELASKTVVVESHQAKIRLTSDVSNSSYGFKVEYVALQSEYDGFVESKHNYDPNTRETWVINDPDATRIELRFSEYTKTELGHDYIRIYDASNRLLGAYSGTELASETIYVNGSTAKIQFTSDGSVQYYGFFAEYKFIFDPRYGGNTVYFSNGNNWGTVNIYYWGAEETEWPGVAMEYAFTNEYSQDVYKFTVPAGTTGIIFNDGNGTRTQNITKGIVDNAGFYVDLYSTQNESGYWSYGTWTYIPPEPDDNGGLESLPEKAEGTKRYFFYMPDEWLNYYAYTAGIYWWEGTDACSAWPGYEAIPADVDGVYYYDVPADVTTIIWNNYLDGGTDMTLPIYQAAVQTKTVDSQYYDPGENDNYPGGTYSFDGMIYVTDLNKIEVNDYSGKETYVGEWFYYYGNGEYGFTPNKGDGEVFSEPTCELDDEDPTVPDTETYLLGDANLDEKINVRDATTILKYVAGLISFSDEQLITADANLDSLINVRDATAILKFIAGIDTGFPIGEEVTVGGTTVTDDTKYYLVGYINGEDHYGDDYLFVDGTLTVEFMVDSYICLMDENGQIYWTDGWLDFNPSFATLGEFGANNNKMHVPAGTVTFTWNPETWVLSVTAG